MNNFKQQLQEGILTNNPIFVQLIGMCSTLAVSTTLVNGIGMGIAVTLVLMCSNLVISLLRKIIPDQIRIAVFIVVIAGFVTIVDLALQAWLPELSEALGIFIPLIVVNCLILARAEAYASKNGAIASLIDGLTQGIGYTIAICIISAIREIIGSGSLLGVPVFTESYTPVIMIILPAGGFLTLGVLMAIFQYFMNKYKKEEK